MPVAFFGIAVGSLALVNAWRLAAKLWPVPGALVDGFTFAALATWLVILLTYAHKWLRHRAAAQAEMQHPVQSSFAALGPVSSMLAALVLANYDRPVALALFGVAVVAQLTLGVFLHGRLWQGGRPPELVTPAIYLPTVAPSFVAATGFATFGWPQVGMWFFGAGMLSWIALESLILHRAAVHEALPDVLRPSLGIQIAPPVVGGIAWMSLTGGAPDAFAMILLGYGLYQALLMARLVPWIRSQPVSVSWWGFSFGVAALPGMALRMVERGATGPLEWLAPALFVMANVVIGYFILRTLILLVQGRLLPALPALAVPSAPAPGDETGGRTVMQLHARHTQFK
jgi:tellurite resistance protein